MIRSLHLSPRYLLVFLLCAPLVGCAHLKSSPTERIDQTVTHSFQESRTEPGSLIIQNLTVDSDRIRALLRQEQRCYTIDLNEVSHQKVREYEAENVGLDIAAGLIFGAGAGALFAASPSFSDERKLNDKGEEIASNQEMAVVGGVTLALSSLWAFGNGIYVYSQTGDRPYEQSWITIEETSRSQQTTCGLVHASPGLLEVSVDNQVLARIDTPNSTINTDLRALPGLCAHSRLLGKTARISFAVTDTKDTVVITEHDLTTCVQVHEAQRKLATAQKQLADFSTPIQFARIAISLREVNAILNQLPADDRDRPRLTEQYTTLETSMAQASRQLLDNSLLEYRQTMTHADASAAVPAAQASLELSRLVEGAQIPTWQRIYSDYVRLAQSSPLTTLPALEKLLDQDNATQTCLVETLTNDGTTKVCSHWLDIELVRETFSPLQTSLPKFITLHATNLKSATHQLEKTLNESTYEQLSHHFDRSEEALALCKPGPWADTLQASCALLEQNREHAIRTARASQTALEQIRIKSTAKAWRGQFAQCRKVSSAAEAFGKLRSCDASCQKIRAQVINDYQKLRNFSVEDAAWDTETRTQVRKECNAAGCPSCP